MKKILKIYIDSYSGLSKESWMLAIVMLLNRTGSMVLPFLGIYLTDKLGFTLEDSGIVLSCFGIGSLIGSFLGGYLTDKLGNFKVQAISLFLSAPLFAILPHFQTLESAALMMLVLSTVTMIFLPANSVAITKYAKKENITRAFSLNRMAVNLGFSFGPALGGFLSNYSYDLLFYGNAIAAGIAGIAFIKFFYNRKERNEVDPTEAEVQEVETPVKERNAYTDWKFILFTVFCSTFCIAFFQILNTLPLFYKEVVKLSQNEIGLLIGFSGFCVFLLEMLLVHWAEKKFTITEILFYGSIITAISYSIFGFTHALIIMYMAIFLMSIGEMLVLPFLSTVTALRAGVKNKGAYMGINGLSGALAFIVSPFIGTWIATKYNFEMLWFGTAIVLLITAFGFKLSTKLLIGNK
ncbi:MFS transporter [Faecalibacter bovis]|uniref:MFS transporter n=1 Tax=Faecalibacter bovis TaxID=2898187 RepID=A0ABX7XBS3_9FLAO|nr:MFS transporter [Faecalibacter bovis]QTV05371.1 MFS transporter [Faecalibacter bovis]